MRTITTNIYTYDELSEGAKRKAREWWLEQGRGDTGCASPVYNEAIEFGSLMGITIGKRDEQPRIFWNGFSSQGDGACFEGQWIAKDVMPGKIETVAPKDAKLHQISAVFERIAVAFPNSSFTVKHVGHYHHKFCTDFSVSIPDDEGDEQDTKESAEAEKELIEAARDYMDWIYKELEQAHDYERSDAYVTEALRNGDYEFEDNGNYVG